MSLAILRQWWKHSVPAILAGGALLAVLASSGSAAVISVNFNGSAGSTTTANGPDVTGSAGAVPAGNFNNATGFTGTNVPIVTDTGTAAGTLSYTAANVYGTSGRTGPGTPGTAANNALMTGYLDNFGATTASAVVNGLPAAFTTPGYQILVYQNADSAGAFGYRATDNLGNTASAFGRQTGSNGANYPLVGPDGFVGSTTTDTAGPANAANYVILSGLSGPNVTITGLTGTTGDGRPRPNGFQIVAVPEPASLGLLGLGAIGLLARRRRA